MRLPRPRHVGVVLVSPPYVPWGKHEFLHHFLICGERHLNYLVHEFIEHYHTKRPHQGIGNTLIVEPPSKPPDHGEIVCEVW